jgi:hypothetical protein
MRLASLVRQARSRQRLEQSRKSSLENYSRIIISQTTIFHMNNSVSDIKNAIIVSDKQNSATLFLR